MALKLYNYGDLISVTNKLLSFKYFTAAKVDGDGQFFKNGLWT